MMFRRQKGEQASPRVDLTPMVDVVFLLLIFFMISTTFVQTPGLDINLPESSLKRTSQKPEEVQVYVDRNGGVFLADKKVSVSELAPLLEARKTDNSKASFVLMADRDVRHGLVVEVMDAARQAGFVNLAIATESKRP
ncbi:MAG: biopolymer transporter ExbD [Deltaproteobacteria bacterium]|nr:MAG: biopolymer transporter ExbD [Deltaproteobacteria bacterium]